MFIPKFEHQTSQALYEKALTKFMKALETDEGKKFITHVVKAFIHSGTLHEIETFKDENGHEVDFLQCDVTHAKLCTTKSMNQFIGVVKTRLEQFAQLEGEDEERFDKRKEAYFEALRTSNPYAINRAVGYTAERTDKILCSESIQALQDLYNKIQSEKDQHPELWNIVRPYEKKPQKPKFNKRNKGGKPKSHRKSGGATLADFGLSEVLKSAIEKS